MSWNSASTALLLGLAFAGTPAEAEPVMHGAMEICQSIDDGDYEVWEGYETCCADTKSEDDDGLEMYGQRYCVVCTAGTDDCDRQEVVHNKRQTLRTMKKALATQTRKPASGTN